MESALSLYSGATLLFAGDFNADPGLAGGPLGISPNEQGLILARYLQRWDYASVHFHLSNSSYDIFTHFSEPHDSLAAIDHILCP